MNDELPERLDGARLAIRTRSLTKRYGSTRALAGVDLTVPEGAFYVLVGPNGSGKTTLLRVLLDLIRADGGEAEVLGISTRSGAAVRANVGYVPEKHEEPYGWMKVKWLLSHHASYHGAWDAEYAGRLGEALEIRPDRRYGMLSKGESRRVQLLLALAHRPPLLLLDEPTDGLDPVARDTVLGLLADHLADSPATVIVSTHLTYEMERLADHIGVMRNGRIAAQLSRDEMTRRLRRYTFEAPESWSGDAGLGGTVLRRNGSGREARWTVWGEESEVTRRLESAGARVREVSQVTLEEAALALLGRKE